MTSAAPMAELSLGRDALDRLMPMHVVAGRTGHILQTGPTLKKLSGRRNLVGARFLEVFEMRRPRDIASVDDMRAVAGSPMSIRLRRPGALPFKALAVPQADGAGVLINLSFGISAVEAVGLYHLTAADFAATDLTIEMLYLFEAKQAVMDLSRNLNRRLQSARIAAEEQAFTDTLTGLKNRRAMDHILGRLGDQRAEFGLMQIDLDFFKAVNDSLGHAAGDHVLGEVARILVEETRAGDAVIRAGGDEFAVLFEGLTSEDQLAAIAERLLDRLRLPIIFEDKPCRVSASIGIVTSDAYDTPSGAQMLADADAALYASKEAGRARHCFFTRLAPATPRHQTRAALPTQARPPSVPALSPGPSWRARAVGGTRGPAAGDAR